ncbi:hypothetical protein H5410_026484, partial [Solanum commersonii]
MLCYDYKIRHKVKHLILLEFTYENLFFHRANYQELNVQVPLKCQAPFESKLQYWLQLDHSSVYKTGQLVENYTNI